MLWRPGSWQRRIPMLLLLMSLQIQVWEWHLKEGRTWAQLLDMLLGMQSIRNKSGYLAWRIWDLSQTQPHAAFEALTHGLTGKWSYLCRATPDISTQLTIDCDLKFFRLWLEKFLLITWSAGNQANTFYKRLASLLSELIPSNLLWGIGGTLGNKMFIY